MPNLVLIVQVGAYRIPEIISKLVKIAVFRPTGATVYSDQDEIVLV